MAQLPAGQHGRMGQPCFDCDGYVDYVTLFNGPNSLYAWPTVVTRSRVFSGNVLDAGYDDEGQYYATGGTTLWVNDTIGDIWHMWVSGALGCDLLVLRIEPHFETVGEFDIDLYSFDLVAHRFAAATGYDYGEIWRTNLPFGTLFSEDSFTGIGNWFNGNYFQLSRGKDQSFAIANVDQVITIAELDGTILNDATAFRESSSGSLWIQAGDDGEGYYLDEREHRIGDSLQALSSDVLIFEKTSMLHANEDRPKGASPTWPGDTAETGFDLGLNVVRASGGEWDSLGCFKLTGSDQTLSSGDSTLLYDNTYLVWGDSVLWDYFPIVYTISDCALRDDLFLDWVSGVIGLHPGFHFHEGFAYKYRVETVAEVTTGTLYRLDISEPSNYDPDDWELIETFEEDVPSAILNIRCGKIYFDGSFSEPTEAYCYDIAAEELRVRPLYTPWMGVEIEVVKDTISGGDATCDPDNVCGGPEIENVCDHCAVLVPPVLTGPVGLTHECGVRAHFSDDDNITLGTCDDEPIPIRRIRYLTYYERCYKDDDAFSMGSDLANCPESAEECPATICNSETNDCANLLAYNIARLCAGEPIDSDLLCASGETIDGDCKPFSHAEGWKHYCKKILIVLVEDECGQVACYKQAVAFDFQPPDECCCWPPMRVRATLVALEDIGGTLYAAWRIGSAVGACVPLPPADTCCHSPCDDTAIIEIYNESENTWSTWAPCMEETEAPGGSGAGSSDIIISEGQEVVVRIKAGDCVSNSVRLSV